MAILTAEIIERKARELQLADFNGDQAKADGVWQADLECDSYKESYRRRARTQLSGSGMFLPDETRRGT